MSIPRGTTLAGRLASLGFADADGAERLIAGRLALDVQGADGELVAALAAAADPDAALAGLARLAPDAGLLAALRADPDLRNRLTAVLGASAALSDHLARHPADWRVLSGPDAAREPGPGELRAALLASVGADPADPEPVSRLASAGPDPAGPESAGDPAQRPGQDPATSLRVAYRRALLRLAARDLTGAVTLDQAAAELSDLAAAALEAALAIARSQLPPGAAPARLAVIAMGKCGGRELNYASDVDVIFVAGPGRRRRRRAADRHPAGGRADPGLLAEHARGPAVPGRREPPAGGPGRPAGPHAGQPPRVLPALGEDLGVPGAAQGQAGGG